MPLSEHEQRQLEQIEQALRTSDPQFADLLRGAGPRAHYRRRIIGAALGFLAGTGLLLAGVVANVMPIVVAGFAIMLACSLWAVTSDRRMTGNAPGSARRPGQTRRAASGRHAGQQARLRLMGRLEERWQHRQHGDR